MKLLPVRGLALCFVLFIPASVFAEPDLPPQQVLDVLAPRSIGPANMSGRVSAVAVVESRPATQYVAAASGGVWKTVNNGITWAPVFDQQPVASIGDVAVAASDPDIVWVGTGEANARNSVSWGDGVYQSTDGGKTWKNRGLRDSHHIARVVVHPKKPEVVYVAVLGHLWGPNKERGLYKTGDGGKTWEQSLFLNENTGFIDLVMDPGDPETLYAAAYRVRRDAFDGGNPMTQFSGDSGLYKTGDGGKTWNKLTRGLPDRPLGRCGLCVYRKDPRILYAVVPTDRTSIKNVPGQPPDANDQAETGGVFRSADRGETWTKLNDLCPRPFYFGQVRVDPNDDRRVYVLGVPLFVSTDGGKTFRDDGAADVHGDHHALWIDPADSDHLVLGCDGGLNFSYDRGRKWEHLQNLPIGQFYAVGLDARKPYRVYGGLQDNGSWGGPSRTRFNDGVTVADWFRIYGADGFYCQPDPNDPDVVYAEGQWGYLQRIDVRLGVDKDIQPAAPKGSPAYRFNWDSPILVSPHNSRTIYYGGNVVFKSVDRGDHWEPISPDVTRGKPGPSDDRGHTITTLAESPLKAGVIWVGADDGRVLVTHNGGAEWIDVSARVPGLPPERCVSRVECSPFAEGTAFLAIDRHRNDDRAPYLFKTEDFGASWKSLSAGLPEGGPVRVVRADPRNRDLLFVGTEFGLFVSIDGGAGWTPLRAGLPPVAVHDLAIHPRDRELVIATHGRSLYVLDAAPLEEASGKVLAEPLHLFDVKPATAFQFRKGRGLDAGKNYAAPNPPYGAAIYYWLKDKAADPVKVIVGDDQGSPVAELSGGGEPGLHLVQWDLQTPETKKADAPGKAGEYTVRVQAGERTATKKVKVELEE